MISKPPNNGATFSAVSTPHFFTVVLQNTLRDNTLLIPVKFVRRYGETLSNLVSVKLPCGSEWKMELRKFDGRIDYPINPSHSDAPNGEEIKDDEFVEILENFSQCPGKRKSSPLPCSQPHKKFRASPIGETESKRTRKKFQVSAEEGDHEDKSVMPRLRKSEVENSNCKVVIKPTQVGEHYDMCLPRTFASEIFKNRSLDGVFVISDGRTWPVKFRRRSRNEIRRGCRLLKEGWKKFAEDNNLKVGDTCVFQLIDGNKKSFKVSILKADSDSHPSRVGERRTNLLKLKRNVKVKTKSACTSKHQEETKLVKFGHGQVTCIPKLSGDSRATEAASRFSSKYPFYKKAIHLSSCFHGQRVPVDFARTYFERKTQTVTLQMGKNSWSVTMVYNSPASYYLSAGWSTFARENSLRPGYVCVYELIEVKDILLRVTIFKK
ncbi:hypothetical protein TIFTF001_002582 [Ficus carica]|uniref:TF-B3 domain-containing protein n=1 Tax=Ficus carica TaxID=3494 RepID=A0AA87ZV16_FICCA|nr:hypothetical protein TIFTF001_002582 [Ficus carica]